MEVEIFGIVNSASSVVVVDNEVDILCSHCDCIGDN